MKDVVLALAAIGGLLGGGIAGVILAFFTMLLTNNGAWSSAPMIAQVVLDLAVAFGIYRTLVSKELAIPTRVFLVAGGAGILGALAVCTTIAASSNARL